MPAAVELAGQSFGKWIVLRRGDKSGHRWLWWCRCECGTEKQNRSDQLLAGESKSCGCDQFIDITGEKFGAWTVLQLAQRGRHTFMWECRCDCGTIRNVCGNSLRSGTTKTCGGCKRDRGGFIDAQGYRVRYKPRHPNARKNGAIFEHVLVMSEILGRPLFPDENVHHINGVRDDNRPENLELWSSSQPPGQRVADKVAWAREILDRYAPKPGLSVAAISHD